MAQYIFSTDKPLYLPVLNLKKRIIADKKVSFNPLAGLTMREG